MNQERKSILSALWLFTMLNYIYADILMIIINPTLYAKAAGRMSGPTILIFAVLMEIPIAMVLLSRILPYRINRWANILAGIESTIFVAFTVMGHPPSYYLFFASIEIACTVFIVWYAWTWRESVLKEGV